MTMKMMNFKPQPLQSPTTTNPNSLPFPSTLSLPKTPSKTPFLSQVNTNTKDLSLSLTPLSPPSQDQALLTLLRQRKTEEAWTLYTQIQTLPSSTCLSRLVSQLSYLKTHHSLSRAQSIVTRLRGLRQLRRLDANSLGLLAVAAANSGNTLYAKAIIKSMLRSGYLPHVKSWSSVVSKLSGENSGEEALRLFRTVCRRVRAAGEENAELAAESRPDTAAFNAALNAAANSGNFREFANLFEEMSQWGVEPDSLSFNVMMKLCIGIGRKDLLGAVVERILETKIETCVTTMHSLVAGFVGFGDLEAAETVVQAMRDRRRDICRILRDLNSGDDEDENRRQHEDYENEAQNEVFEKLLPNWHRGIYKDLDPPLFPKAYPPDSRIYTTLMKGYMKVGRVTDTVRMLEAMRHQEDIASRPDHVSYTTVVTAFVNAGSMERARQVLAEMKRIGVPANRRTYNILLKGHCKQLQISEAKELMIEMSEEIGIEPDVVSYNTMIDGCILVDDSAGALEFFNEMRAKGIAPSKISYTTLMKAFALSGQPKLAHKVFDEMINDSRVKADIVAWNMLVEGYCRLGYIEDAKKVIQKMRESGIYPNVATYGSLANGIALARKPGEALLLWSEVKERCSVKKNGGENPDPNDSSLLPMKPDEGLLDTLADICVRAAFFKKALEIVACMEENGISPNKTKYTRIYVEMHSRMFTSKHASQARQDRRKERKRAAEAFKFWLGLPNSYYGSEWRLEPEDENDYTSD